MFMFYKKLIFLILSILILSCNKSASKKNNEIEQDSLINNSTKIIHHIAKLNSKAKDLVANWDEYQNIDELLIQYQNISTNLALLNAKELSVLANHLKDSIRVENLKIPSVKIRLNVLHNETLRLADMASIPRIKEEQVIEEKNNILNAYSALNLKINNIVNKEYLNEEVNSFVDEVLMLNDSLNKKDTLKTIITPK